MQLMARGFPHFFFSYLAPGTSRLFLVLTRILFYFCCLVSPADAFTAVPLYMARFSWVWLSVCKKLIFFVFHLVLSPCRVSVVYDE